MDVAGAFIGSILFVAFISAQLASNTQQPVIPKQVVPHVVDNSLMSSDGSASFNVRGPKTLRYWIDCYGGVGNFQITTDGGNALMDQTSGGTYYVPAGKHYVEVLSNCDFRIN